MKKDPNADPTVDSYACQSRVASPSVARQSVEEIFDARGEPHRGQRRDAAEGVLRQYEKCASAVCAATAPIRHCRPDDLVIQMIAH